MTGPTILAIAGSVRSAFDNARLVALAANLLAIADVIGIFLQLFSATARRGDLGATGSPEHAVRDLPT